MRMKSILIICLIMVLSGCQTSKDVSGDALAEMCNQYELAICGDLQGDTYVDTSMEDIVLYTRNNFSYNQYIYTSDIQDGKDYYDYMYDTPMRGDCEDYVITLMENLILLGMIGNGQAKWVFGKVGDINHAWLLVKKGDDEFLFDTYNRYGINVNGVSNYSYIFTVYEF